jgi:hypothetical protein
MKRWPAFILLCSQLICGTSAWGNSQSALGWQRTGCEETKFRFPELSAADTNRTQNQLPDRHVNRVFVGVRRPDIGVQALLAALVGFGALVGGVLLGALSSNPDPVNRLPRRKPYPQKAEENEGQT